MSPTLKECPACRGTGGDEHVKEFGGREVFRCDRCKTCGGSGKVEEKDPDT